MKKLILLVLILVQVSLLNAQNVQTLYHTGKKYLTTTLEVFKTDKFGSTYSFVDMDYGREGVQGVSMAYWEFSRGIKFWENPFELHVEYNGGFGEDGPGYYPINDAWLFGGNYTWNTKDFSKIFTLEAMYKTIRNTNYASFQITGVWTIQMFKEKVTFTGFADFWREDNTFDGVNTKYILLTEPQLWYNVCKKFAIGSEVRFSNNFAAEGIGFKVNPTIAAKFTL